jgi:hypothetical protein
MSPKGCREEVTAYGGDLVIQDAEEATKESYAVEEERAWFANQRTRCRRIFRSVTGERQLTQREAVMKVFCAEKVKQESSRQRGSAITGVISLSWKSSRPVIGIPTSSEEWPETCVNRKVGRLRTRAPASRKRQKSWEKDI